LRIAPRTLAEIPDSPSSWPVGRTDFQIIGHGPRGIGKVGVEWKGDQECDQDRENLVYLQRV
jgi:hypothetical protein